MDEDVVEDGWKVDVDVGLYVAEYGVGFGFGVGVTRATVLRPPARPTQCLRLARENAQGTLVHTVRMAVVETA